MSKPKKTLVNTPTDKRVPDFLEAIANQRRKADSKVLLELIREVTGLEPVIWGERIVGFGQYSYRRKNGDQFDWFHVGFSPGKAHLTVYVMYDINSEPELLEKLGPHTTGKGCLYLKRLEGLDLDALREIIAKSDRWAQHIRDSS